MTSPARWAALLVALAVLATFLPARTAEKPKKAEPRARIGLVFDVGGRGDKSFNDAAFIGVSRAEDELGVEASYLEPASTEDREAALRLFAARGCTPNVPLPSNAAITPPKEWPSTMIFFAPSS